MPFAHAFTMLVHFTIPIQKIKRVVAQDMLQLPPSTLSNIREIKLLTDSPNLPWFLSRLYTSSVMDTV
jgi:hypothetical protein